MSFILLASITICLFATGGALYLLSRLGDWHLAFLAAMTALVGTEQAIRLFESPLAWTISFPGPVQDIPGLTVSLMVWLAIFFLERMIRGRKRAEEALQQSQALLMDAIESTSEGFILYGSDERLVLCNSRYRELYPAMADLLVPGTSLEDVVRAGPERGHLQAIGDIDAWVRRRLKQYRTARGTVEYLSGDRRVLARERRTQDGGIVGIRTDITEIKRAEEALRESEERFRDLAEIASDWIWELDADLKFSYLSDGYFRASGSSPEDIIGKHRAAMPPESPGEEWTENLEDLRKHLPFSGFEWSRKRRDGSSMWISSSAKPILMTTAPSRAIAAWGATSPSASRPKNKSPRKKPSSGSRWTTCRAE